MFYKCKENIKFHILTNEKKVIKSLTAFHRPWCPPASPGNKCDRVKGHGKLYANDVIKK